MLDNIRIAYLSFGFCGQNVSNIGNMLIRLMCSFMFLNCIARYLLAVRLGWIDC